MSLLLTERVALVTGASRGIGRGIAQRLAENGVRIVVSGRTASDVDLAVKQLNEITTAVGVAGDISSSQTRNELLEAARSLGGLDIVVNNAGKQLEKNLEAMSDGEIDDILDTNLSAVLKLLRDCFPLLHDSSHARVINIASAYGFKGVPGWSAYTASKGGLIAMGRTLATEWGKHQICVNTVAPGHTETDMTRDVLNEPKVADWLRKAIPLRRVGQPEDIAGIVALLASDDAAWITGQCFVVDGGWSVR